MIESLSQSAAPSTAPPAPGVNFTLVDSDARMAGAVHDIQNASIVGLDLETTGLSPRRDSLRLVTVATATGCWLVDAAAIDPAPLLEAVSSRAIVGHNLAFDLGFLAVRGFEAAIVHDTMLMHHLAHAGESGVRNSLAEAARRELDVDLSKELQRSDWSGPLTAEQLAYAASDAAVLLPLWQKLQAKLQAARMAEAADIENRCLPAMVWIARSGAPVDERAWKSLISEVEAQAASLREELDRTAPPALVLDLGFGRNWDNPREVMEALRDAGCPVESAREDLLSELDHPLAGLLRRYRETQKLLSTYGESWLEHLDNGRVYPDWRQMGASSGRMACSSPNLQQIPRDRRYRACFAAPPGRCLIKADYSQIELRIAARVAEENRMIEAYRSGADLHTLTARQVLGKSEVTKQDRQLAKAINFGLLYGMGAEGFRRYARTHYGVSLSADEAGRYREAFFTAYPRLRAWHRKVRDESASETRTLAGRRRAIDPDTPLPLRLNTPIQGTGADGLKKALALLWERRSQSPGAMPVMVCHDEIVVESPLETADQAAGWLRQAMLDGMQPLTEPVPVDVEVQVAQNWGG